MKTIGPLTPLWWLAVLCAAGTLAATLAESERAAPRVVSVSAVGAASLGAAAAPLTMVYATDYACGTCREFALTTLPALRRSYVESGRLRLVLREHAAGPAAVRLAVAVRCAGEFGKYWEYHDALFAAKGPSEPTDALQRIAALVGVPADPFARCVQSGRYAAAVRAATTGIDSLGLGAGQGPLLIVGRTRERWIRGEVLSGAPRRAALERMFAGLR